MFLSRLFKNARSKVMIALAGLTMVFGTAAAITTVATAQQNEVVETKASYSGSEYLYLDAGVWNTADAKFRIHVRWQTSPTDGQWSSYGEWQYGNVYKIKMPSYGSVNHLYIVRESPSDGSVWNSAWRDGQINDGYFIQITGWGDPDNAPYNVVAGYNVTVNEYAGSTRATRTFRGYGTTTYSNFTSALNNYWGYSFSNYYTAGTGGSQVTSTTSATTIYARYTAKSTKTLYFDGGSLWSSNYSAPYAYAYDANGKYNAAWPGVAMSKRDNSKRSIYGGFVWTVTIPSDSSLIFNPGGDNPDYGKTGAQTVSSVTDGQTFLINTLGTGNWYTSITLSTVNQDTSTTTNYFIYKNGGTGIAFTMPSLSKSGYTATWNTKSDGTGDNYTPGTGSGTGFTATTNTLYSKFVPNTYTITFNQNDASGGYFTASKTHGVAFTIPAPGESPISEMGPSGGRYFIRWDTSSEGTGTSYAAGASYTADSALTLHMIQGWYTYWYSLDGGDNWTQMVVDNTDKPAQYDYQHRSASIALTGGETITFCRTKTTTFSDEEAVTINEWQNNVNGSGVITYTTNGKIYLKINREGNPDVYVEGSLTLRWIAVNGSKCTMSYTDANSDWYTSTAISLHPGDEIQAGYSNEDPYNLSTQSGDGSFSIDDTIVCEAPGVFVIHLLSDDGGFHFDEANFVMDAAASAVLFAQTFNTAISDVCTDIVEEGAAVTSLSTPWGTQATYYASLTSDAQTAVKSGSSDSNVTACRAKYDYVCGKYGPNGQKITGVTDFMGRNPSKPASAGIIPGSSTTQSPLTITLWIVLGSGLAGLAAIGTAYFVSKKKKRYNA